ncbi:Cp7Fa [Drosophila busckii]|uniref:Cp7Fa n=1 Tax=Drosophila busckii TaxID=30019 RepID=A0A0M4EJI6_DROBS|nr:Cp7Fa [Drosophila busckii]
MKMRSCQLLLTLLVTLLCIEGLLAACVCSEKGTDYCQSCQGSTIVRPKPRYYETSEVNLAPIGDNCWCSKQLIEPAQLPKTCGKVRELFQYIHAFNNLLSRRMLEGAIEAKTAAAQRLAERLQRLEHIECHKRRPLVHMPHPYAAAQSVCHMQLASSSSAVAAAAVKITTLNIIIIKSILWELINLEKPPCKPSCSCSKCSGDNSYDSSIISSSYNKIGYAAEKQQDESPAADPISVSLAAQAGKAINVPEAKLAYGFAQKPVDGQQKVFFSNVPEENLFKLKSEVITLKKRNYAKPQEEEEDYVEEEEEQASDDDDAPPQLTYKQLGYATEQFKNPKFKKVSAKKSSYSTCSTESDGYGKVAGKVSVDCGFKPGRITSYRNARRQELDEGSY